MHNRVFSDWILSNCQTEMSATRPRKRTRANTRISAAKQKKKAIVVPPGYRSCCCGSDECKTAMLHYFRNVHNYDDPAYFFPWLYIEVPKMPKASTKSRSKARRLERSNKLLRHRLFLKHLGISAAEKRSLVAYPVHFALPLYVACVTLHVWRSTVNNNIYWMCWIYMQSCLFSTAPASIGLWRKWKDNLQAFYSHAYKRSVARERMPWLCQVTKPAYYWCQPWEFTMAWVTSKYGA